MGSSGQFIWWMRDDSLLRVDTEQTQNDLHQNTYSITKSINMQFESLRGFLSLRQGSFCRRFIMQAHLFASDRSGQRAHMHTLP